MLQYFRVVAINGPRQSGKTTPQKKIGDIPLLIIAIRLIQQLIIPQD
jgi:predicted AAA+ superfamily ATPase